MSASAKNMEAVYKAKQKHDSDCPYGGVGQRVLFHPYDLDRMRWEEGDVIAGLVVLANTKINTGMMRVECDAEPDATHPGINEETYTDELVTV
jgi:hypothetical protein